MKGKDGDSNDVEKLYLVGLTNLDILERIYHAIMAT
jgi:hypothetical protein